MENTRTIESLAKQLAEVMPDTLTDRQKQAASLMALGLTYGEVADVLGISTATVVEKAEKIRDRLGLKKTRHATVWALKRKLNSPKAR